VADGYLMKDPRR